MLVQLIVAVIAVALTAALSYLKWCHTYWKKKGVFTLPPSIPFGNTKDLVSGETCIGMKLKDLYNEVKSRGLPYGGFYLFGQAVFVPVDLDLLHNILIKDFQHFTDRIGYVNEKEDPLSGHLFNQKGAKWKALRHKLSPTFSPGKLKAMIQTLVACTDYVPTYLDETISRNESVDIKEMSARYTTDVITSVAFGLECNSLKNSDNEFRKIGKRIISVTASTARLTLFLLMPRLCSLLKVRLTTKDVEDFIFKIVHQAADHRDKNNVARNDMMQLLLDLRSKGLKLERMSIEDNGSSHISYQQDGLSLDEVAAQVLVFFAAGFETTSTTMTFCMYELATHLEIQERVRMEINEVLEKHNGKITYEALGEMQYFERCIHETLRKHPPVPALPRECTMTYTVPGTDLVINKGTSVMFSVYGIHHDPEYYPEPEKFDPERFTEENRSKFLPSSYLPFGEGPRVCIGPRLGILQVKVGLVAALKNFRFTLNSKTETPLSYDPHQFTLGVKGGVWLNLERI